jgi:hypothetical protein
MKQASLLALLAAISLKAASLDWHWSNPLPFGNDVVGLAWRTNGSYVAVCDHGQMFASVDLSTWASVSSGTTRDFQAAAYFGSRLVAVGASGLAWWADDLSTPHVVDLGTTDWLVGLVATPTLVVAVGDNGAVYTSADGAAWRRTGAGFSNGLRGVAWSGSLFAAVGTSGRIATSPDGNTWTTRASGVVVNLNSIAWRGSGFIAVGDGGVVLESGPNGAAWTKIVTTAATGDLVAATVTPGGLKFIGGYSELRIGAPTAWLNELDSVKKLPAPVTDYYALLAAGSQVVAAGEAGELVTGVPSSPGYEYAWTPFTSPPRTWLFDLATFEVTATNVTPGVSNNTVVYTSAPVTNALYVAVGDLGSAFSSDDGVTWLTSVTPTNVSASAFFACAGNASGLLAVGSSGVAAFSKPGYSALVSTNVFTNAGKSFSVLVTNLSPTLGSVWKAAVSPATGNLTAAAANSNLFVVAGDAGFIATSPDASSWTPRASGVATSLSGLASFPNGFVAVGDSGVILSSTNGADWTPRSQATTNWIYKVRWCGGRLVAVGENGAIYTSTDAAAWSLQTSGVTNWLNDVTYSGGAWYAVGDQGTVLSSTNAVAWSVDTNIFTSKSLYAAATLNNQLVAAGFEGVILRAQTAPLTNAVMISDWPSSPTNHVFIFSGVVDQTFTLQRATSLTNWTNEITLQITDPTGVQPFVDGQTNASGRQFFRTLTVP